MDLYLFNITQQIFICLFSFLKGFVVNRLSWQVMATKVEKCDGSVICPFVYDVVVQLTSRIMTF